jgi:hypothetical protein
MSNEVTPVSIPSAGAGSLFDVGKTTPSAPSTTLSVPGVTPGVDSGSFSTRVNPPAPTTGGSANPQAIAQAGIYRTGQNGGPVVVHEKKIADGILEFFSSTGPLQTTLSNVQGSVEKFKNSLNVKPGNIDANTYRALKYQYANMYIATSLGKVGGSIDTAGTNITNSLDQATNKLTETLKPVSSFVGNTLGALTGVMKNPLGAVTLIPTAIGGIMDEINPQLKQKLNSTYEKNNTQKLSELPGQVFGNIQQLVKIADGILSVPIGLIGDTYRGFLELMGKINDFINKIMAGIQKAFNSIIDGLFPGLTDFLNQAAAFTNQIGQIATVFGGINQITQFTNQLTTGLTQFNAFVQNPLNLAFAYAPPQVSQNLYLLQNPQQIINNFLPPQLSEAFAQISSVTGFGFNGNMGYGLQSVLQGLQGGVLSGILQGFATQFSILSPLFGAGQAVSPTTDTFSNQTSTITTPDGTTYNTSAGTRVIAQTTPPKPNYGAPPQTATPTTPALPAATIPATPTTTGSVNAPTGVTVGGGITTPRSLFDLGS